MSGKHCLSHQEWVKTEIDLLRSLPIGMSGMEICKLFPLHTMRAVVAKRFSMGLSLPKKRFTCFDDYFSIPTPVNSYWAGFIAADGSIAHNRPQLRVALASKDISHLASFRRAIGCNSPISHGRAGVYGYCALQLTSKKLVADLNSVFNITPRKTFTLLPPTGLSNKCALAYCIGLIDGDGSVFEYHANDRVARKTWHRRVMSVVGTESVIAFVEAALEPILGPLRLKHSIIKKLKSVWELRVSGYPLLNLYQSARELELPWLHRKWSTLGSWLTEELVKAA